MEKIKRPEYADGQMDDIFTKVADKVRIVGEGKINIIRAHVEDSLGTCIFKGIESNGELNGTMHVNLRTGGHKDSADLERDLQEAIDTFANKLSID